MAGRGVNGFGSFSQKIGVTSFVVCWTLALLSFFRRTSRRRALTRLCDERIDPIQNLLLLISRVWYCRTRRLYSSSNLPFDRPIAHENH